MVDNGMLEKVYRVIKNKDMRVILKTIGINGAMSYSEIMEHNKKNIGYNGSSKTGYYIRHLKNARLIIIDSCSKRYILSRIGVQSLDVVTNFEKICKTYDMSDVDAEGKIEFEYKIVGRKL